MIARVMTDGGPLMWPLLALACLATLLLFERIAYWVGHSLRVDPAGRGSVEGRLALGPATEVAAWFRSDPDRGRLLADRLLRSSRRGIAPLRIIALLSTSLGLLGTVVGVSVCLDSAIPARSEEVGHRLSLALYTTVAGLIVYAYCHIILVALGHLAERMKSRLELALRQPRTQPPPPAPHVQVVHAEIIRMPSPAAPAPRRVSSRTRRRVRPAEDPVVGSVARLLVFGACATVSLLLHAGLLWLAMHFHFKAGHAPAPDVAHNVRVREQGPDISAAIKEMLQLIPDVPEPEPEPPKPEPPKPEPPKPEPPKPEPPKPEPPPEKFKETPAPPKEKPAEAPKTEKEPKPEPKVPSPPAPEKGPEKPKPSESEKVQEPVFSPQPKKAEQPPAAAQAPKRFNEVPPERSPEAGPPPKDLPSEEAKPPKGASPDAMGAGGKKDSGKPDGEIASLNDYRRFLAREMTTGGGSKDGYVPKLRFADNTPQENQEIGRYFGMELIAYTSNQKFYIYIDPDQNLYSRSSEFSYVRNFSNRVIYRTSAYYDGLRREAGKRTGVDAASLVVAQLLKPTSAAYIAWKEAEACKLAGVALEDVDACEASFARTPFGAWIVRIDALVLKDGRSVPVKDFEWARVGGAK